MRLSTLVLMSRLLPVVKYSRRVGLFAAVLLAGVLPTTYVVSASDGAEEIARASALPNPAIHYTFDTDLLDVYSNSTLTAAPACPANPCNSASSFGSDADGKYWTWSSTNARGGGFTLLTSANIGTSYTIALKFSFSQVTSWRKIIDYEDRVTDNGFYYYNSKLQFYNGGSTFNSTTTYPANTVLDLVVVRESTNPSNPSVVTGTFTVYAVGSDNSLTQLFQYSDTIGNSIPHVTGGGLTKLGFFFDDTATGGEATPTGKVYDLRIWSGSALNVQTLNEAVVRPAAVSNIVATPAVQSINVSWSAVTGATSYVATAGTQSCTVNAPATSCTITGLTDGSSSSVSVQAIGSGGYSNVASTSTPVVVGASTTSTTAPAGNSAPTTAPAGSTTTVVPGAATSSPSIGSSGSQLPKTGQNSTWTMLSFVLIGLGVILSTRRRARVPQIHRSE